MAKMQLLTYTVMEGAYGGGKGKLMNVKGWEDAVPADSSATPPVAGSVGTVDNPTVSGILIDADKWDPVVFSFVYDNSGTKELRMLLATIVTPSPPGVPSTECRYSLLKMETTGDWTALGTKVQLVGSGGTTPCANNPHGVAQIGNMLYIIDYDTQMIYLLDGNALNGKTGGTWGVSAFNIGSAASLPDNARAQALIALPDGNTNYLFALYIRSDPAGDFHEAGILVRVEVTSPTTLTYRAQTTVGKNPQMIIPIHPSSPGVTTLLIPAIGGKQQDQGLGNYGESNITKIGAFNDPNWNVTPGAGAALAILVSNAAATVPVPSPGDPPAVVYTLDLQAVAASGDTGNNEIVYILSGIYQGNWTSKKYALWKTTVGHLNTLQPNTLVSAAQLTLADTNAFTGYFWDIFYENKGGGQVGRLWFLRGSPIIVSEAADYGAGNLVFDRGTGPGTIYGQNVNSVDLTAETARQVQAGVSLRRGLLAHKPGIRAAKAIRATKAAPAVAEEEEEGR
jgi:hypothetical protein